MQRTIYNTAYTSAQPARHGSTEEVESARGPNGTNLYAYCLAPSGRKNPIRGVAEQKKSGSSRSPQRSHLSRNQRRYNPYNPQDASRYISDADNFGSTPSHRIIYNDEWDGYIAGVTPAPDTIDPRRVFGDAKARLNAIAAEAKLDAAILAASDISEWDMEIGSEEEGTGFESEMESVKQVKVSRMSATGSTSRRTPASVSGPSSLQETRKARRKSVKTRASAPTQRRARSHRNRRGSYSDDENDEGTPDDDDVPTCKICGDQFTPGTDSSSSLQRHILTIHAEDRPLYVCDGGISESFITSQQIPF